MWEVQTHEITEDSVRDLSCSADLPIGLVRFCRNALI